jgi:hypothetical protein
VSRYFPISWNEWKEGAQNVHDLVAILEARAEAGDALTEEEQSLLASLRSVAAKYDRNGYRKSAVRQPAKKG